MQISGSMRCCLTNLISDGFIAISTAEYGARPAVWWRRGSVEPDVLEVDGLPIDAHDRRRDPIGELSGFDDAPHQARDEGAVTRTWKPLVDLRFPRGVADHSA